MPIPTPDERAADAAHPPQWWRDAVIYQVYPRSFADSNADGDGDLRGLIDRLDHLAGAEDSLGVDAIWLTPVYPSPWRDGGYDVTDYTDIDPRFGTLAEMDELITAAHARGLRIILDWVPNHTSSDHPWFRDARSSRQAEHRAFYVWSDGSTTPDGNPLRPNNWLSAFDTVGPAWTYDDATRQWYLHSFSSEQPDLNWDNPDVRHAMHRVLRFWAARGVDGFRIDVAQCLGKDPALADNPFPITKPTAASAGLRHDEDWPSVHERLRELHDVVAEYGAILMIGEVYVLDPTRLAAYVAPVGGLDLAHNFTLINAPYTAQALREAVDGYEAVLDASSWPACFLNNHDHSRVGTRWTPPHLRTDRTATQARARLAAVLLLTLRGTPFLYQGEELGLTDAPIAAEHVLDLDGRDPVRVPLPWTPESPAHGFTSGTPWLPMDAYTREDTIEYQRAHPDSTLSTYRRLLRLRASRPALRRGTQSTHHVTDTVWAYRRTLGEDDLLIAVNLGDDTTEIPVPAHRVATILVSSGPTTPHRSPGALILEPHTAFVADLHDL